MPSAMGLFVEVVSDLLPMLDMEDSLIKVYVTDPYSLIKVFGGLHYHEIYDILST